MVENTVPAPAATEEQKEVVEAPETSLVEEELLVEDVSIDGMCGVY
jgi:mycofactocin precursor